MKRQFEVRHSSPRISDEEELTASKKQETSKLLHEYTIQYAPMDRTHSSRQTYSRCMSELNLIIFKPMLLSCSMFNAQDVL